MQHALQQNYGWPRTVAGDGQWSLLPLIKSIDAFHIKPSCKKMVFLLQLGLKHISHSHTLSIKSNQNKKRKK